MQTYIDRISIDKIVTKVLSTVDETNINMNKTRP